MTLNGEAKFYKIAFSVLMAVVGFIGAQMWIRLDAMIMKINELDVRLARVEERLLNAEQHRYKTSLMLKDVIEGTQ